MQTHTFAKSRDGSTFGCIAETETDGAFTLLSNYGKGYRSAHRDAARAHFDTGALWCMNRLTWINTSGVRVVLTRWQTQAFRIGA